jgi:hypothetical protein
MRSHPRALLILLAVVVSLLPIAAAQNRPDGLPESIPDGDFWKLIEQLSEAPGTFPSGNPLSDEWYASGLATALAARARQGGGYIGVGREQNFTYIAAVRPRIAFIADIHRRNLYLQLLYKALFELSTDRVDFVSRLFTKPRPTGLKPDLTATELMDAYWNVATSSEEFYKSNLQDVRNVLTARHRLPLSADDLGGIAEVYYAFYWHGPSISHTVDCTFADLVASVDHEGRERSFLSTEEAFTFVQTLHRNNLIVPVVTDLAGPKSLRAIGENLRQRKNAVTAFYVAGVPATLSRTGRLPEFCANVATLPVDSDGVFLRTDLQAPLNATTGFPSLTRLRFAIGVRAPLVNRPTPEWSAAAVVPIADALNRCQ